MAQVVMRGRRGQSEAARDHEMLRWIGRFRFVTASELSVRFAVSERRVNSRLARFIREGLVDFRRESMFHARVVWLTSRGAAAVELPRRKPPRADIHIRHELLVVGLAAQIEVAAAGTGPVLWTERECRQAHDDQGERWCVDVHGHEGGQKRWPDLVVQIGERRRAVELELAVKHSSRMRAILEAYADRRVFDEVLWLIEQPAHRRRVREISQELDRRAQRDRDVFGDVRVIPQRISPWPTDDVASEALAPFVSDTTPTSLDVVQEARSEAVRTHEGPRPASAVAPPPPGSADDDLFDDDFVFCRR